MINPFTLGFSGCLLLVILMTTGLAQTQPATRSLLGETRQLVIVTTPDWQSVQGSLQRYERDSPQSVWRPVGQPVPIVVGRTGLAWGIGLHGLPATYAQAADPLKREGDGKAPAGVFALSAAFGYASPAQARGLKLPYRTAGRLTQCVDDAQSAHYNDIVERARIKRPDWQSHEDMRRQDDQYRWGVIVDHNSGAQRQPGGGSCIFLHIWVNDRTGTAGCTAMAEALLKDVLFWLDAKQQPLLVQLPAHEHARLQAAWQLPKP